MVAGDTHCTITAILFFVASLLNIIYEEAFSKNGALDSRGDQDVLSMNAFAIGDVFARRAELRGLEIAAGACKTLAWIFLCIVMVRLAIMFATQRKQVVSLSVALGTMVMVGAFTETTSTLLYLGMVRRLDSITQSYNLDAWLETDVESSSNGEFDQIGWKTLELIRNAMTGLVLFIDSAEFVLLAGIVIAVAVAVFQTGSFSNEWAATGLLISLLSIVEFVIANIAFVDVVSFGQVAVTLSAVNQMVLLPFWLLWLGCMLPAEMECLKDINATSIRRDSASRLGAVWAQERRSC